MAKAERQLSILLKDLNSYIRDQDELGRLVGYCVVSRLLDFQTSSRSQEEISFSEVKAVHGGLEEVLDRLKKNTKNLSQEGYAILCELRSQVDAELPDYLTGRKNVRTEKKLPLATDSPKFLLEGVVERLRSHQRNYADLIRRDGLALLGEVKREVLVGTKRILERDYQDLSHYFMQGVRP